MNAPTGTIETTDPTVRPTGELAPRSDHAGRRHQRPAPAPIPFARLVAVEARKTFDTRAGLWLLVAIGVAALAATGSVILFAPDEVLTFDTFGTAIGFPMAIILPMVAILAVTSEWSQRSGLTTFTLVPHRGRVIGAKALVAVGIGVVSMVVALGVGALGNLVGTAITGTPTVWDISAGQFGGIVLGNVLGLLLGFTLGVLLRSSPAAIVGYFVYGFVMPTILGVLAATQQWFADRQGWLDFNFATTPLFDGTMTDERWAQLAVSGSYWLALPLVVGLRLMLRSEVK